MSDKVQDYGALNSIVTKVVNALTPAPVKKIYHRVKINHELLKFDYEEPQASSNSQPINLQDFLVGQATDTLPKGKCIGLYFLSYVEKQEPQVQSIGGFGGESLPLGNRMAMPEASLFLASHTNIRIEDTRGRLIAEPTDIQDYDRKNWNAKGYKELDVEFDENEQITINYETKGDAFPICGEFVFVIEQSLPTC